MGIVGPLIFLQVIISFNNLVRVNATAAAMCAFLGLFPELE